MPSGYSGAPAIRYFSYCSDAMDEAHNAIIRLLIPDFETILTKAEHVTKQQAESMLSIGGGGEGLWVHRSSADGYRTETETCIREQILDARSYARAADEHAEKLDEQADELLPLLNAMMPRERPTFLGRNIAPPHQQEVPDKVVRKQARVDIDNLRADARTYRNEAIGLRLTANNLEGSLRLSGTVFVTDCDECIACDTFYAGQFEQLATELQLLAGKFQNIRDSFCPSEGVVDWDALITVKDGMSDEHQAALTDAMAEALALTMLNGGDYNWDLIEKLAGLPYAQWTDAIEIALAAVYVELEGLGHKQRFINALVEPIDGVFHFLCYDKVGALYRRASSSAWAVFWTQLNDGDCELINDKNRRELFHRAYLLRDFLRHVATERTECSDHFMNVTMHKAFVGEGDFFRLEAAYPDGVRVSFTTGSEERFFIDPFTGAPRTAHYWRSRTEQEFTTSSAVDWRIGYDRVVDMTFDQLTAAVATDLELEIALAAANVALTAAAVRAGALASIVIAVGTESAGVGRAVIEGEQRRDHVNQAERNIWESHAVQQFELDVITSSTPDGNVTFRLLPTASTPALIGAINDATGGVHGFTIEGFVRNPDSLLRVYSELTPEQRTEFHALRREIIVESTQGEVG